MSNRRIKDISGSTAQAISAAQVVVSLSAVVKELVENSIDAKAKQITIQFIEKLVNNQDSSSSSTTTFDVVVLDDGKGIDFRNQETVENFVRHRSSSKRTISHSAMAVKSSFDSFLSSTSFNNNSNSQNNNSNNNDNQDADVDGTIATTLGFRGEALHSIAQIAHLTVSSKVKSQEPPLQLSFIGDAENNNNNQPKPDLAAFPDSRQSGTKVTVGNLFHSLPVRRSEFYRNQRRHLADAIQALRLLALSRPEVRIHVSHQPPDVGAKYSTLLSTSGSGDLQRALVDCYGARVCAGLQKFSASTSDFNISGYLSKPGTGRSAQDMQFFFLDGRHVKLQQVQKLINECYSGAHASASALYPIVVLQLNSNPIEILGDDDDLLADDEEKSKNEDGESKLPKVKKEFTENGDDSIKAKNKDLVALPRYDINLNPKKDKVLLGDEVNLLVSVRIALQGWLTNCLNQSSSLLTNAAAGLTSSGVKQASSFIAPMNNNNNNGNSQNQNNIATMMFMPSVSANAKPLSSSQQQQISAQIVSQSKNMVTPSFESFLPASKPNSQLKQQSNIIQEVKLEQDARKQSSRSSSSSSSSTSCTSSPSSSSSSSSTSTDDDNDNDNERNNQYDVPPSVSSSQQKGKIRESTPVRLLEETERMQQEEREFCLSQKREKLQQSLMKFFEDNNLDSVSICPSQQDGNNDANVDILSSQTSSKVPSTNSSQNSSSSSLSLGSLTPSSNHSGIRQQNVANSSSPSNFMSSMMMLLQHASQNMNNSGDLLSQDAAEPAKYSSDDASSPQLRRAQASRAGVLKSTSLFFNPTVADRFVDEQFGAFHRDESFLEPQDRKLLQQGRKSGKRRNREDPNGDDGDDKNEEEGDEKLQTQSEDSAANVGATITSNTSWSKTGFKNAEQNLCTLLSKEMFSQLEVIGQFNRGFILTISRSSGNIFIFDQHASDEKANYEKNLANFTSGVGTKCQVLLKPEIVALDDESVATALENSQQLAKLGFRVAAVPDEPSALKVSSIPLLPYDAVKPGEVGEIVEQLKQYGAIVSWPHAFWYSAATLACRRSIMIGTDLDPQTMARVVARLQTLNHPWNCPHGRPTVRHVATMQTGVASPFARLPMLSCSSVDGNTKNKKNKNKKNDENINNNNNMSGLEKFVKEVFDEELKSKIVVIKQEKVNERDEDEQVLVDDQNVSNVFEKFMKQ